MAIPLKCRCGEVQGTVEPGTAYTRATCYCRDCQAFARFLGRDGITDANGGTDIVPTAPDSIAFTHGLQHLQCMSLSDKGLLRWYADCCRTPVGNSGRTPRPFYFGLTTPCLDATETNLAAAFGPRDRTVLFAKHARGTVSGTPLRFALGGARIMAKILQAKLAGKHRSPFFDADGRPIRAPTVLSLDERRRLQGDAGTAA